MTVDTWINFGMLIATVSLGGGSLWFTRKQWKKVEKKIGMINVAGKAFEILPTWYTSRMMNIDMGGGVLARDYWPFGLLMSDGRTIVITGILSLSDDGKWMDVELCTKGDWSLEDNPNYVFAVGKDRTTASVQVSHIVTAMELVTS